MNNPLPPNIMLMGIQLSNKTLVANQLREQYSSTAFSVIDIRKVKQRIIQETGKKHVGTTMLWGQMRHMAHLAGVHGQRVMFEALNLTLRDRRDALNAFSPHVPGGWELHMMDVDPDEVAYYWKNQAEHGTRRTLSAAFMRRLEGQYANLQQPNLYLEGFRAVYRYNVRGER